MRVSTLRRVRLPEALTDPACGCNSPHMQRFSSAFVSILTFAVALASVSCACADSLPIADDEAPAHVRHHDHEMPANSECADGGCGGNGGFAAVVPERGFDAFGGPDAESPDEGGFVAWSGALNDILPTPIDSFHHPPAPAPYRTLGTPVTRFEKLLN